MGKTKKKSSEKLVTGEDDDESKFLKQSHQQPITAKSKKTDSTDPVRTKSAMEIKSAYPFLQDIWFWLFISTVLLLLAVIGYIIATRCCPNADHGGFDEESGATGKFQDFW